MGTRVVRCEEGSVGLPVMPRGVGGGGRVGEGKEGEHNKMLQTVYQELFGDSIEGNIL